LELAANLRNRIGWGCRNFLVPVRDSPMAAPRTRLIRWVASARHSARMDGPLSTEAYHHEPHTSCQCRIPGHILADLRRMRRRSAERPITIARDRISRRYLCLRSGGADD